MDKTEFKISRENFCQGERVVDTTVEQSVEKDFVLPDYCADIFRILKCIVEPAVVSQTINGGKLTFEICVTARVLYCSEGNSDINCIVQKMNYTKSVDMTDNCLDPSISIQPVCDYVNCRVISPRRLDIRGAVSSRIIVCCNKAQTLVSDASGGNIQLRKQLMTYPSKRLTANKRVTMIEEVQLAADKPPVSQVIRTECSIKPGEQKMIAGKLVTKGDANIYMLYSCVDLSGENSLESMRFTVPFSQIIDIEGIDESFEADVEITPAGCEILTPADKSAPMECEIVMLVSCEAVKYETAEVVTDAYSTKYETELTTLSGNFEATPEKIEQECSISVKIEYPDDEILRVYDSWADGDNISISTDEQTGRCTVRGNVKFSALVRNKSGMPVFLETESPFEQPLELPEKFAGAKDLSLDAKMSVKGCEYHMPDGNTIQVTAATALRVKVSSGSKGQIVSDIKVDTEKPKQCDESCCVKLCCCGEGEDIWDIAKRYSTSISAIIEENELDENSSGAGTMLLIPLIK